MPLTSERHDPSVKLSSTPVTATWSPTTTAYHALCSAIPGQGSHWRYRKTTGTCTFSPETRLDGIGGARSHWNLSRSSPTHSTERTWSSASLWRQTRIAPSDLVFGTGPRWWNPADTEGPGSKKTVA